MDIDIERLEVDAAYWDEVAPDGATHYIIDDDCDVAMRFSPAFYRDKGEQWQECGGSSFWRKDTGNPLIIIPRPTQWSGDGLPPVGVVCEVRHPGGWHKAQIACYVRDSKNVFAVYQFGDDINALDDWSASTADYFRPLKSDKERAVEAALKVCPYPGSACTRVDVEALYDAGLLTIPKA